MAYQLVYPWHKHPRILLLIFDESVSDDSVLSVLDQILRLMEVAEAPLHVLFDFSATTQISPDLHNLLNSSKVVGHPQRGHWVFLQPNEFISFSAKILRHQAGVPIEFIESEDLAWEFFNQMGIC